jgi:serine/threonine protein kinase
MAMLSGRTIKGYEIQESIGQGAFGAVYRAHQTVVDREVAIKVILPQYANQPDFIRRFETEAQLVARLEHLHIVPLYDYWRDPDGTYLIMCHLRGGSLKDWIGKETVYHISCKRHGRAKLERLRHSRPERKNNHA